MKNSLYVYIEDHIKLILFAFLFGVMLALTYDIFRIIRTFMGCGLKISGGYRKKELALIGAMKERKKIRFAKVYSFAALFFSDLLYSLMATVSVLIFFYYLSDGIVRWFAILSMGIGFWFYMKTVGFLTGKAAETILFVFITFFRYAFYFTVKPAVFAWGKFALLLKFVYMHTIVSYTKKHLHKRSEKKIKNYTEKTLSEKLKKLSDEVFET